MRTILIFAIALTAVTMLSNTAWAAGNAELGQKKSVTCVACHMSDGNSVNPEWPKIAGQIPGYVVIQLKAFRAGKRVNPVMAPLMKPLSDRDIQDLAAFFATQKMSPGVAKQEAMALGEKIYNKGVFYTPLIACTGCHGMKGRGNEDWEKKLAAPPSVLAPVIGGQHAAYTAKQLKAFRSGERSNDVGKVMRKIAEQMSDEQIEAVAQYIAQLNQPR